MCIRDRKAEPARDAWGDGWEIGRQTTRHDMITHILVGYEGADVALADIDKLSSDAGDVEGYAWSVCWDGLCGGGESSGYVEIEDADFSARTCRAAAVREMTAHIAVVMTDAGIL